MNFAREGLAFIIVAALITAAAYAAALTRRSWPLWLLAFVLTLVALWVAYFFRDPERSGARGDQLIIAPADGKVVMVTEVDEPTFLAFRQNAGTPKQVRLALAGDEGFPREGRVDFVDNQLDTWARVVKENNIKAE